MKINQIAIGKIANFINGYAFKPTDWNEKGYKIIRIQNLTNKSKPYNYTNKKVSKKYIVQKGDILVSWSATIDIFEWDDEDAYLNQHIFKVEFDDTLITKSYFKLALKKTIDDLSKLAHGSTMKHITKKKFDKHKIPLPPSLDDQRKIANLLTQVEALISKREESIELLDELLRSSFLDMFGDPVLNTKGWEVKSFKYFAKIDTNMTKDFEKYQNYPHIGVANIEKNTGKLINYKLIKDENLTSGKYLFTPKHIIYSKIRPNLNKVALPNFNGLASADSYPILVYPDITNRYFFAYVLRSDAFLRFILNFSVRANIPKINKKQLEKFFCYNPPKSLQDKFATIVKQVESTKKKYQDSLSKLNELFESLSQKAFKGNLDLSKMELVENQDEPLEKMIDSQKVYDRALETKVYESSLTSIKSISKENLETYIFDLIKSNSFIIEDIQHLFETDFTFNEVKEKIFEMLEDGKIKQNFKEEYKEKEKKFDYKIELVTN